MSCWPARSLLLLSRTVPRPCPRLPVLLVLVVCAVAAPGGCGTSPPDGDAAPAAPAMASGALVAPGPAVSRPAVVSPATLPVPDDVCLVGRVTVADLRGDGRPRVYAGSACAGGLLEFTPAAGGWSVTSLLDPGVPLYGVAAGDGRGDGRTRLYVARGDHRLDEVSFRGGGFAAAPVGEMEREANFYGLVVGADLLPAGCGGVAAAGGDGSLHCFAFGDPVTPSPTAAATAAAPGPWTHRTFPVTVGVALLGLAAGDGRGDGQPRLYASADDGEVYEIGFAAPSPAAAAGAGPRPDVARLGAAQDKMCDVLVDPGLLAGGVHRVLAGSSDGGLYSFRYRGGKGGAGGGWTTELVARAAAERAILALLLAPAGDGRWRLYAAESSHEERPDHALHELTPPADGAAPGRWQDRVVARLGMMARPLSLPGPAGGLLVLSDQGRQLTLLATPTRGGAVALPTPEVRHFALRQGAIVPWQPVAAAGPGAAGGGR